jgi:hypothetical protein
LYNCKQVLITAETSEVSVSNYMHVFTFLHAIPPHKIVIWGTEATFVTECVDKIIMDVSEYVFIFVLDVTEIALNVDCQCNDWNICDSTESTQETQTAMFLCLCFFLSLSQT